MAVDEEVTEVSETSDHHDDGTRVHREHVRSDHTVSGNVMAKRIVYYIGGVLLALLALRFIFALFGAWEGSAFVSFIYNLTDIFVMPFYGIFGEPVRGESRFETSTLVAIGIYSLVIAAIGKLLTLDRPAHA
jgi:hypothetical protein